jgi:hypothetical protein
VYTDNKWEGESGKAGMGKYTRYRRWTRIAVLSESAELVGPGDVGVQREEQTIPANQSTPVDVEHDRRSSVDGTPEVERTGLRQRLKLAVSGSSATM